MILVLVLFCLGYAAIALEHPIKVHKTATALILAAVIWVLFVFSGENILSLTGFTESFSSYKLAHPEGSFFEFVAHQELLRHIGEIAEILFFLMGAMTIVEVVDQHGGFSIITNKIATTNKRKILWILALLTFFLSALLDNLTTTIVMCALLRKIIPTQKERWFFAGVIVLAANSGGAWSPIGDVTTIMLWIGRQITASDVIIKLFVPSLVSILVPLTIISFSMKGNFERIENNTSTTPQLPVKVRNLVFFMGVGGLLFVPVFKSITHLPPYIGMLFSLGVLWLVTERLHYKYPERERCTCGKVISRIDMPSILFFLGILLAVAGLQSMGYLNMLGVWLNETLNGNIYYINICIGILSSIVDNVPLVAGAMGMYPLSVYPTDHTFWIFLAYCAGVGGNLLIIGSAAGIAAMGMEKIDFIWYLKKISFWALIGFFAGAGTFVLMNQILF